MSGGPKSSFTSLPFFDVPFLLTAFAPALAVLAVLVSLAAVGGESETSLLSVFSFGAEVALVLTDFGGGRDALCFSNSPRMACLEAG